VRLTFKVKLVLRRGGRGKKVWNGLFVERNDGKKFEGTTTRLLAEAPQRGSRQGCLKAAEDNSVKWHTELCGDPLDRRETGKNIGAKEKMITK